MRIVVYCQDYFVGVTSVFEHGEKLGLWVREKDRSKITESDYLILGSLDNSYNDEFLKRANAILLTSTLGQMELMNEFIPFLSILSKYKHLRIFCGHLDSCKALSLWLGRDVDYFPYPINVVNMEKDFCVNKSNKIGMFLPNSPRKNITNQASGFLLAWVELNDLQLHTNLSIEGGGITQHSWLPRDQYLKLLNTFDFMLHVTFTESLSYGVIDSINCGSIPIVSKQVADYFGLPEHVVINNVDSAISISYKIRALSAQPNISLDALLRDCRFRIKVVSEMNNSQLRSLTETLHLV